MIDFNGYPIEVGRDVSYVDVETANLHRGRVVNIFQDKVIIAPRDMNENIVVAPRRIIVQ